MPDDQPTFDFGRQYSKFLTLRLSNALRVYGLKAFVFPAAAYNNDPVNDEGYENSLYPEFTVDSTPRLQCRVLLDTPIRGLNIQNFISGEDKVDMDVNVITDVVLSADDVLEVHFPDAKILNLRVIDLLTSHAYSTSAYKYRCTVGIGNPDEIAGIAQDD